MQLQHGDSGGFEFLNTDGSAPLECAKRSYELKCVLSGVSCEKDVTHDGGDQKNIAVLITSGPHKKKKGKIIGGGHGLFLVELSGREKGTLFTSILNRFYNSEDACVIDW